MHMSIRAVVASQRNGLQGCPMPSTLNPNPQPCTSTALGGPLQQPTSKQPFSSQRSHCKHRAAPMSGSQAPEV